MSLFSSIRLPRVRIRIPRRGRLHGTTFLVAGSRPPAIFIFWQVAHLRTLPRSSLMLAVAIAQRRVGTQNLDWRLTGQSNNGCGSQKNCDPNAMTSPAGECHDSVWDRKQEWPIVQRIRFSGIRVLAVLVPKQGSATFLFWRMT